MAPYCKAEGVVRFQQPLPPSPPHPQSCYIVSDHQNGPLQGSTLDPAIFKIVKKLLCWPIWSTIWVHIDGLVQEKRNSIALAVELRFSCTNLSISQLVRMRIFLSDSSIFGQYDMAVSWLCHTSSVEIGLFLMAKILLQLITIFNTSRLKQKWLPFCKRHFQMQFLL